MTLDIRANDHGAIYVLEIAGDMPLGLSDKTDEAMMALLGPIVVNRDYVDVIEPAALTDMSVLQLIETGYDMPVDQATADSINATRGTIVLIMSAAFAGQAVKMRLPQHVRHVATLRETPAIKVTDQLSAQSAGGNLSTAPVKPPKSDARVSGIVATSALLVMFALVGLMIWIGR